MKKVLVVILLAMGLVAGVTGCGGARYDGRLVAADSLMQADPDSALALVSAVNAKNLATEGDRAYRDLLMTQARYKAYQDILSSDDSAITRAMGYYHAHNGEREKLTRAYLYKGAVMEELGHVDSAMYYYKTAEVTADPKDYANLGQINTRIGTLYQWYYVNPQICYEKFKIALDYYRLVGNKRLQIDCLFNMAGCSGITHIGDPKQLLSEASLLAAEISDSDNYFRCQELLCRQLSFDGKYIQRAKQIAMHCLNNYRDYVNHDLLLDLADIYAYSGMPDSARYYLDMVTKSTGMTNPEQVQARKYLILSKITSMEGDSAKSNHYDKLAHQVSDSILNSEKRFQIQQIENDNNFEQKEFHVQTIHDLRWLVKGIITLAILALLLFAIYHYRRMNYIKSITQELRHTTINRHEQLLEQVDVHDSVIGQFVKNMVLFMQSLMDASEKDGPTALRQRVKEGIGDITTGDDFWDALKAHVDLSHGGLITRLSQHPNITAKELRFIELCCCGFDYVEISIIMGYTPKYISQKRKDIAAKLQLDMPLLDYLEQVKTSD